MNICFFIVYPYQDDKYIMQYMLFYGPMMLLNLAVFGMVLGIVYTTAKTVGARGTVRSQQSPQPPTPAIRDTSPPPTMASNETDDIDSPKGLPRQSKSRPPGGPSMGQQWMKVLRLNLRLMLLAAFSVCYNITFVVLAVYNLEAYDSDTYADFYGCLLTVGATDPDLAKHECGSVIQDRPHPGSLMYSRFLVVLTGTIPALVFLVDWVAIGRACSFVSGGIGHSLRALSSPDKPSLATNQELTPKAVTPQLAAASRLADPAHVLKHSTRHRSSQSRASQDLDPSPHSLGAVAITGTSAALSSRDGSQTLPRHDGVLAPCTGSVEPEEVEP